MNRARSGLFALLALLVLLWAAPARAQEARLPGALSITGRVLDAYVGGSLQGAEVALVSYDSAAALPDSIDDGFLRRHRFVARETAGDGTYRFADVSPGVYLVSIRRPGYRPVVIRVAHAELDTRVSVALELEPISLAPVEVKTRAPRSDWIDVHGERAVGTLPVERLRQRALLASDARVISAEDVRQAATPGEADVFRTLHRLPGVSTRDDWSAEVWTRGASFGETRVYLDGLPLFNPLHAFGLLSGMSSHGIGPTVFQPGVRSAAYPEGAAAVVDLTSRSGRQSGPIELGAEATLASLQTWASGSMQEGEGGWQLAGRRSWIDVGAINPAHGRQGPFVFSDLNGRLDLGLGRGARATVSAFLGSDRNSGFADDRTGSSSRSTVWLTAAEVELPIGRFRLTQSIGATRDDHQGEDASLLSGGDRVRQAVEYVRYAGEVADDGASRWRAGYDLLRQSSVYDGALPWPYDWRPADLPTTSWERGVTVAGLWGERRWRAASAVEIETSLRGTALLAGGDRAFALQPAVLARWAVTPSLSFSGGAGRYLQYSQSPGTLTAHIAGPITGGRIWTIDGHLPALDVRQMTLGAEAWVGEGWLFSGTLYRRTSENTLLPNPTPGLLEGRLAVVAGSVHAEGIDLSVRRLAGRLTGSVSYSLGRALASAEGRTFRPPTDRRHLLDAAGHLRLTSALRFSVMYSFASGAPYASVGDAEILEPCSKSSCATVGPRTRFEDPFGQRAPSYAGLDVALDWNRSLGDWGVGLFLQVQNVLRSRNAVTYRGARLVCSEGRTGSDCLDESSAVWVDDFYDGISVLPLLGVRIGF